MVNVMILSLSQPDHQGQPGDDDSDDVSIIGDAGVILVKEV